MKYNPIIHTKSWYEELLKEHNNAKSASKSYGISRKTLYNWKKLIYAPKPPHKEFLLEDIVIFLNNKKIQQKESRGVVDEDIDIILDRVARKGRKDRRTAKILIRFVNEYLREQQA